MKRSRCLFRKSGEKLAKMERNFLQSGGVLDTVSNFRNAIRTRFIAIFPIINWSFLSTLHFFTQKKVIYKRSKPYQIIYVFNVYY